MTTEKTFAFRAMGRAEEFRPNLRKPFSPPRSLRVPSRIRCDSVSVVIPVKNNQQGIDRFLQGLATGVSPDAQPREVIVVDNNSEVPTSVQVEYPFPVRVLECRKLGPGAARNVGVSQATGEWILFTDSDCLPSPSFVEGYVTDQNEAVAYAGQVETTIVDQCTLFYVEQRTFLPTALEEGSGIVPSTIVTANSLVLKDAFHAVGGFDEEYIYAGGEDTDLGYRLRMVGQLRYNLNAVMSHEITDGLPGFIDRFLRYGRGQRLLDARYDNPGLFRPKHIALANPTDANRFLAEVCYHSSWWGFVTEKYPEYLVLPPVPPAP